MRKELCSGSFLWGYTVVVFPHSLAAGSYTVPTPQWGGRLCVVSASTLSLATSSSYPSVTWRIQIPFECRAGRWRCIGGRGPSSEASRSDDSGTSVCLVLQPLLAHKRRTLDGAKSLLYVTPLAFPNHAVSVVSCISSAWKWTWVAMSEHGSHCAARSVRKSQFSRVY